MARFITITGGKGGVGKTNVTINTAVCLAQAGHRVCVLDADLGLANVNVLMNLYPEHDLEDVISGQLPLHDIIIRQQHGIDIIPGSSGAEQLANLDTTRVGQLLEALSVFDEYDYVLVDTSAGISSNVIAFCQAAAEIVVVITSEPTSLTDAYALLKVLHLNNFSGRIRVVVNQCRNSSVASRAFSKLQEVTRKYLTLEIEPLGIVISDRRMAEAVERQQPLSVLYPDSNAARCLKVIAGRMVEQERGAPPPAPAREFWSRFMDFVRTPLRLPERQPVPPVRPPDQAPAEAGPDAIASLDLSLNLPTLPHILFKLLEACNREEVTGTELAGIIAHDPALRARVLRLANSAHYGFARTVTDVEQAFALIGMHSLRSIALSASIYQVFGGVDAHRAFDLRRFWWHSLLSASIARVLARSAAYPDPEQAFLAGLLHDAGMLLMLQQRPETYRQVSEPLHDDATVIAAEQRLFGYGHHQAGAVLAQHWKLPSLVVDAIRYHHESGERITSALPLVRLVHAANLLAGESPDALSPVGRDAAASVPVEPHLVATLLRQAREQAEQVASSLDIPVEQAADEVRDETRDVEQYLAAQVRDISLLQATQQEFLLARDQAGVLQATQHGLQVLFDVERALVLLCNELDGLLEALLPGDELTAEGRTVVIPLRSGSGMIADALLEGKIHDSIVYAASRSLGISDEQIIRLLGAPACLCLPMLVQGRYVGVVVLGVDQRQQQRLRDQTQLLSMFAGNAALSFETERVRREHARQVVEQRMAAAHTLARKVAHEVNNPLSIIKNYLKILELELQEREHETESIGVIQEEIDRVAAIVSGLSDAGEPETEAAVPVRLEALVADLCRLMQPVLARQQIRLAHEIDADVPVVRTGRNSLKQILLNIIKNAAEAIGQDGSIQVVVASHADGQRVEIRISDTGPGLDPGVRERLFEPFVSTKRDGHAGLGLSVVYGLVNALRGSITCESAPGQGTMFRIVLPVEG